MCQILACLCPLSVRHPSRKTSCQSCTLPLLCRKLTKRTVINDGSLFELHASKAAKYEFTANRKASWLSSWKHCLSGHQSLNCNEWFWQDALVSAHWWFVMKLVYLKWVQRSSFVLTICFFNKHKLRYCHFYYIGCTFLCNILIFMQNLLIC